MANWNDYLRQPGTWKTQGQGQGQGYPQWPGLPKPQPRGDTQGGPMSTSDPAYWQQWWEQRGGKGPMPADFMPGSALNQPAPYGLANQQPGGLGAVLSQYEKQGLVGAPGVSGAYADILKGYTGDIGYLKDTFLPAAAPFIGASLEGTPAFRALSGRNFNPMQAYGEGSGQIAAQAEQARMQGSNALARQGLGRTAATSSLASQTAQAAGNQQSGLFTNLYQGELQQRQRQAQEVFDAQRSIAQIALGQNPIPRAPQQEQNPWAMAAGAFGNAIGSIGGGFLGAKLA